MDLSIFENHDGGDVNIKGNDFELVTSLFNQPYLAMFGGNPGNPTIDGTRDLIERFDYWGNELFFAENIDQQYNSRTEDKLLNVALGSAGIRELESIVKEDLSYLKGVANVTVVVSLVNPDKVQLDVTLQEPTNLEERNFIFLWDGTKLEDIKILKDVVIPEINVAAPSNLVATPVSNRIDLSWQDNSDNEFEFKIRRGTSPGNLSDFDVVAANETTFEDDTVTSEDTFFYDVIAVRGDIESDPSNEATATALFQFSFQTNMPGAGNFDPTIAYTAGDTPIWLFEDGTELTGVSISTLGSDVGLDGTTQTVILLLVDKSGITKFQAATDNLVGAIDFSVFVGALFADISINANTFTSLNLDVLTAAAGMILRFDTNNTLTTVTLATADMEFSSFQGFNCASLTTITNLENIDLIGASAKLIISGLSGSANITIPSSITGTANNLTLANTNYNKAIDFSGWTGWTAAATIQLNGCNITSASLPTMVSGSIRTCRLQGNEWTSLDMSGMIMLNGEIFLNDITEMTSFTSPTGGVGTLQIFGCTGLTSLDLSSFDWVNGIFDDEFDAKGCTSLTSYTPCNVYATNLLREYSLEDCDLADLHFNSITSGAFDTTSSIMNWSGNTMTAAEVNQALVELDAICSSTGTAKVLTLTGDNAAPDGSSGGFDGDAAVTSLVTKNWTVNTN